MRQILTSSLLMSVVVDPLEGTICLPYQNKTNDLLLELIVANFLIKTLVHLVQLPRPAQIFNDCI